MSAALSEILIQASAVRQKMKKGLSLEKALACCSNKISAETKSAVQAITYDATRHCVASEMILKELVSRPPKPDVAELIMIALALLIAKSEKPYVIVDEAVKAVKSSPRTQSASGLVNACLRRFLREERHWLDALKPHPEAVFNAPSWWIRKMQDTLGVSVASAMLQLQRERPPLVLRVNRLQSTPAQWCEKAKTLGIEATPVGLDGVILARACNVSDIPGFAEGTVSVQDAGAQLAAQFLSPQNDERILDACAAPGGKTAHLLELARCDVTALEVDSQRATKILSNLNRLKLQANVQCADAADTRQWWDGMLFDKILLDAPCTASGIARRHPDIVFSRRPADIASLAMQQKRLLNSLWKTLKVGGSLLYVVCSVFEEEGNNQIDQFLASHSDASCVPLYHDGPCRLKLIPTQGESQSSIVPAVHDGFFYALLKKN